jgi:hypothetical protein
MPPQIFTAIGTASKVDTKCQSHHLVHVWTTGWKTNCDRWGLVFTSPSHYKDRVLEWIMRTESFASHEFVAKLKNSGIRTIGRKSHRRIKGIYDIYIINIFLQTLIAVYKVLWYLVCFIGKRSLLLEICLEEFRWQCVLMASKMSMADYILPLHLSFGLVNGFEYIFINAMSVNLISMACISQDNYLYVSETISCPSYE